MDEDTLRPLQVKRPEAVRNGVGYIRSEEPPISGRDRQCGEPRFFTAYLRRAIGRTDPTILPPSTV
jgi:hypothetical protein